MLNIEDCYKYFQYDINEDLGWFSSSVNFKNIIFLSLCAVFYLSLIFSVWICLCHCWVSFIGCGCPSCCLLGAGVFQACRQPWTAHLLFKHTEHKRISLFFTPWRLTQRVNLGAHSRAACYHQSSSDHQLVFGCTIKVMFSGLSIAWWIRVGWYFVFWL